MVHNVLVPWSIQMAHCTLLIAASMTDFVWLSPATQKVGMPYEPKAALNRATTTFVIFYLISSIPVNYMYLKAMRWKYAFENHGGEKKLLLFSWIQLACGLLSFALVIASHVSTEELYWGPWLASSHWGGALIMLLFSNLGSLVNLFFAFQFAKSSSFQSLESGKFITTATDGNQQSTKSSIRFGSQYTSCPSRFCVWFNCCCTITIGVFLILIIAIAILYEVKEPISQCFGRLSDEQVNTSELETSATIPVSFVVGEFAVKFFSTDSKIFISHSNNPSHPVWQSTEDGKAFIRVAFGDFSAKNDEEMGSFQVEDHIDVISEKQFLDNAIQTDPSFLLISGRLRFKNGKDVPYLFNLTESSLSTNQLNFEIIIDPILAAVSAEKPVETPMRIYMVYASKEDEDYFGFGQQFNYFNQKGACIPILTREQGIGRGTQPLTLIANTAIAEAAGSWQSTYSAIPHYLTSYNRSIYFDDPGFIVFDLTRTDTDLIVVEIVSHVGSVKGAMIFAQAPLDVVEEYSLFSGRMRPLPTWVSEGAILGIQGGTVRIREQVSKLLKNNVPLRGLWIQDWSGKRTTEFGDRLRWNWVLDKTRYGDWDQFVIDMHALNISILTYINPYLADIVPNEETGALENQEMFAEAKNLNCLVLDKDGNTLIQISASKDFTFGTVDLTNPVCRSWYVSVIQVNMLNLTGTQALGFPAGAVGWMADFAESIPFDAKFSNGDAREIHNDFPFLWAETCREAITVNVPGIINFGQEATFFTRSSSRKSAGQTTLMWLGDQMSAFNDYDGLETVIAAASSLGLSGMSFAHSDVGGYVSIKQAGGAVKVFRTKELNQRWCELSAFMDSMFRSHEGTLPRDAHQLYSDDEIMLHFGKFTRVFRALGPYRSILSLEATNKGYPVARHPFLNFPTDKKLFNLKTQIMLGTEFMICPVLRAGKTKVDCYLPKASGTWVLLWDSNFEIATSSDNGITFSCPSPIGKPCVLYPKGSEVARNVIETLKAENNI